MCIADDFRMYYAETYVGVRGQGEEILPFYVTGVDYQDWFVRQANERNESLRSHASSLYTKHEEVVQALQFHGHRISSTGDRHPAVYPMADLILENPELGYIKIGNAWKWVCYTAQQSAKKGVLPRRLTYQDVSRVDVYNLFNIKPEGDRIHRDFVISNNKLKYKGVDIGRIVDDHITVGTAFEIMENLIRSTLPQQYTLSFE